MKNLLSKAINFAKVKHEGQTRKGSNIPYITHLVYVAKLLEEEKADIKTIIVGVLHDTLEDTNTTIEELTHEFGVEIAYMVDTLSEKKGLPYNDRKHMQSLRIKHACREVKMVKCADCLSNLTDIYEDLKTNPNVWSKFNAGKQDIQKHYKETIDVISELRGTAIYNKLANVYRKVFEENEGKKHCMSCTNKTLSEANRPYEKQIAPSDCSLEVEVKNEK